MILVLLLKKEIKADRVEKITSSNTPYKNKNNVLGNHGILMKPLKLLTKHLFSTLGHPKLKTK